LTLSYLGPAPGKVGIDQANALGQWKGRPQGCKVPLSLALLQPQIEDGIQTPGIFAPLNPTQLVDVSIQPGGRVCADPPDSTLGIVTWQTTTVSDVGSTSSTASVTAQFIQSDGPGFPQPGPEAALFTPPAAISTAETQDLAVYGPVSVPPPPACNASLPNTLDAGDLTLSGPGFKLAALQPSTQGGRLTYQATLAPGTLQGGAYQLIGQGGSQVGAFTANVNIPPPITPISLPPGTNLRPPCVSGFADICPDAYGFYWTGGDDRSIVTIQFIVGNSFEAVV
jgi:hypothetical protein